MRMINREIINEKIVITTKEKLLLWPKIRKFECQRQIAPSFWEWLELPERKLVSDSISFQLDVWVRNL